LVPAAWLPGKNPAETRGTFVKEAGKWIGVGVAVLLTITIAFIVFAWISEDFRVVSRDIAIVILAVFQMIASLLVIVLLIALLYAVQTLNKVAQENVLPKVEATRLKVDQVLENSRATAGNVRNAAGNLNTTTVFLAERVASPIIRVSSILAGVRVAASLLARRGKRTEPQEEKGV
jgi:hypothetical protein